MKQNILLFLETLSLSLSKLSNNHGQNWGKALVFTLLVLFIPFGIFYAPHEFSCKIFTETVCNKDFYADMVTYFNPTNYSLLENYIRNSPVDISVKIGGVFVFMLGKIFTAYGLFEIIQAFRKFNTKS